MRSHARVTFRVRGVATLLFFSGACALVYQVAWFRELRLIFGASTTSSAAVLAIFMGGLGLGGARLGKRADESPNPLAMYAKLEIAVACAAGATPALVWLANTAYLATGGSASLGDAGATAVRVVLSVVVLGPATFLMGGTLPAAARAVERDDDGARRSVATLYGVNTMGGVMGAVVANFCLLEVLGTRMTLWMAALTNLLVGVMARSLARGVSLPPAKATDLEELGAAEPVAVGVPSSSLVPPWFPPAASALVGASFMLMELTWYRMLAPLLGGSSYTFGLILAVALVGIAIGGVVYARTKIPATLRWFVITCSLEALFIAIPYAAGDRLALVTALLRPLARVGFVPSVAVWTAVAGFVVLPAAVVSGIQFPLVIGLYGRGARGVGRDVGAAYLANTVGSILGSIAGGFGLIPLLGAVGSWKVVVLALSIGATVAVLVDAQRSGSARSPRAVMTGLLAWLPSLLLLATGPTAVWRHSGIGAGRADAQLQGASGAGSTEAFTHFHARNVRWEADGRESSVALTHGNGFSFHVNGKADGHALIDAPTQVMSGLLAALLHGSAKSVLVVGLGTGSTAGWLGAVPSIERVDVVELERDILRVARDIAPVNEHVLDNPKVHVHLADAREYLRTTKERYDIIFSEPSNPFRAGISSLYTVEYYRAAAQRIAPGGLFVQWVQAYEIDGWAIATAILTLKNVFADVEVWQTMRGDLLLIARAEHTKLDLSRLRKALAEEPYGRAARAVWHTSSAEGVLAHFVARSDLSDVLATRALGAINTDDQNFLEFAFARNVGRHQRVDADLITLSRRLRTNTPDVVGEYDRLRVTEERWFFQQLEDNALSTPPAPNSHSKLAPVIAAFADHQYARALGLWKDLHHSDAALAYGEILLVGESAARAGERDDAALIDRAPRPERDIFRALWAVRHGDDASATEALVRTFVDARTKPWIVRSLLEAAIELARAIGTRNPKHARALYDSLREPFSVEASREERLLAAAALASTLPDPAVCVEALNALEPPPWERALLTMRVRCYGRAKDPRAERAEKDLVELLEVEAPFGESIPTPPIPPHAAPEDPPAATVAAVATASGDAGSGARPEAPPDARPDTSPDDAPR